MWELCGIFVWCRFQQNIFEKVVYKPVYKAYNKRTEGIVFFCLDENGARMTFEEQWYLLTLKTLILL